ncbi:hypothetical protein BJ742DRAFT_852365 [Cladochytrium replicatum]|nr:hypothetical protein BJ742DRAFT_852365 [Cladochytrium replicatum]
MSLQALTFIVKSTVYCTVIVGAGYACMKVLTPSSEQMQKTLHMSNRKLSEEEQRQQKILNVIFENAKSDRPVWDVRGAPTEKN